jgi:hypothetical protein
VAACPAECVGRGSLMGGNVVNTSPGLSGVFPCLDDGGAPAGHGGSARCWVLREQARPRPPAWGCRGRLRLRAGCASSRAGASSRGAGCSWSAVGRAGVVVVSCGAGVARHTGLTARVLASCGVLWVVGCRWRGVASGWPRGVCELDSGCEHLDRRDLPALSGAGGVVV